MSVVIFVLKQTKIPTSFKDYLCYIHTLKKFYDNLEELNKNNLKQVVMKYKKLNM